MIGLLCQSSNFNQISEKAGMIALGIVDLETIYVLDQILLSILFMFDYRLRSEQCCTSVVPVLGVFEWMAVGLVYQKEKEREISPNSIGLVRKGCP